MKILVPYLFLINILAFFIYALDKSKAKRHLWRIPEKYLITLALLGGTPGSYAAMHIFRHKTQKPKFYIGIPLIFILQAAITIILFK